MIASNYHIKRLASLLLVGVAEIRGRVQHENIEYYIIDDLIAHKTWHVPVFKRPTWRKFEDNGNTISTP